MNQDNFKKINNFSLIFVAFVLIQPVIALMIDLPSSLFVFKKVADLLNIDFIQSGGRYVIAAINIVVITCLYIKKYRAFTLKFSLALLSCAIIAHLLIGVQLPFYGKAQTSMYGMIDNGDYFSAIYEARNYGFSSEDVILTSNGYKIFVPESYDFGFSFVSYLIAFGLNLVLLKWNRNNKPAKTNRTPNEFKKFDTYYDPRLPERSCPNCSSSIKKGKVVCGSCGKLDSSVIST